MFAKVETPSAGSDPPGPKEVATLSSLDVFEEVWSSSSNFVLGEVTGLTTIVWTRLPLLDYCDATLSRAAENLGSIVLTTALETGAGATLLVLSEAATDFSRFVWSTGPTRLRSQRFKTFDTGITPIRWTFTAEAHVVRTQPVNNFIFLGIFVLTFNVLLITVIGLLTCKRKCKNWNLVNEWTDNNLASCN